MRNTKDLLKQQFSQLAIDACRKMTQKETRKFFKDCPTISRKHRVIVRKRRSKKSSLGKFLKSGKPMEVWEVDGKIFEKLWQRVERYAYASVYESLTRHLDTYTPDELDDLMSDIKCSFYRCLRFHGPTPNDCGFSKKIGVIISNTLRNKFRKKTGVRKRVVVKTRKRIKGFYKKNPIEYPIIMPMSKLESEKLFDVVDDTPSKIEKIELMAAVPENLQKAVELLLGNSSVAYASRQCGLPEWKFMQKLQDVFSELRVGA